MSKKHFIALADVVRANAPIAPKTEDAYNPYDHGRIQAWELMRDTLADFCASQSPQFDRERWLDYVAKGVR